MQQQTPSSSSGIPAPPKPRQVKLTNPLLSAAATTDFPFPGIIPMPVTPASPAILRKELDPPVELDNFISQGPPKPPTPVLQDPSPPQQQPHQQQEPQKQGYFSSILSSLPNLSLSTITSEDSRLQPLQQQPQHHNSRTSQYLYPTGANHPPSQGDFNAGPPTLSQQQQQQQSTPKPPPSGFPPSGGAGSYRLGNQRRLKYAPPPDLTTSPQQHHCQPLSSPIISFPSAPNTAPPTFFNPASGQTPLLDTYSPSAPPLSAQSSQGSSLHNSFRNSPVGTSHSSVPSFQSSTAPQSIPLRLPEPATPQNTPADFAFSGFSAYRQQQVEVLNPFAEPSKSIVAQTATLSSIKEGITSSEDKTFTPISAAKVTEKLENFIAEQNDDTLSVKSELSAEVATITAGIVAQEKQKQIIEELTEIDLNATSSSEVLLSENETQQSLIVEQEQSLESLAVPSAIGLFEADTSVPNFSFQQSQQQQQSLTNPFSEQQQQANTDLSSFQKRQQQQSATDPFSFQQQQQQQQQPPPPPPPLPQQQQPQQSQSVSDPFALVQTSSTSRFTNNIPNLSGPPNIDSSSSQIEQQKNDGDLVDLMPQYIWGSNETLNYPSVLNPIYGASQQQAPAFFNSSQFENTSHSFSPTSANTYAPSPTRINSSSSVQLSSISSNNFHAVPEPTGSATLSPVQMSVSPLTSRSPQDTVPPSLQNLASGLPERQMQYRPVYHHWFYRREVEAKTLWIPFSMHDSLNLEDIHNSNEISPETKVATDGGRYDVEILRRQRSPVYWTGPVAEVRRCSWFYKGSTESRYIPYEESVAARLEEEFKQACTTNVWNRRVDLNNGEYIIFHSSTVQAHYLQATTPELAASWGNNTGNTSRPKVVKRGLDEFNIDDGEPERVDHLLFLVHGIGSVCDLKFRTVEEVVDEFRSISLQLVQSHYKNSSEQGIVNRIEVLPISWHATLHSGIDKKLQVITLESIPKLRHFTNDTLLDILFYTSPIYCETIMQTVGNELNRLYSLFRQRNPEFEGSVYLGGHSLGSLIMFDLLCHQKPSTKEEKETNDEAEITKDTTTEDVSFSKALAAPVLKRKLSKKVSYVMGTAGTGQPFINYPQLAFEPRAFFALGSPIGMFVTVRGIDTLGEDFQLPTCPAFFNIFHPFDPVAYRVESLINSEAHKYRPMLIPHHKGRKRMHLELKETMARVGADLKQRLLESVRSTWNSVYQLAMFHKQDNQQTLEQEIEKVVEEQMNKPPTEAMQSTTADDAGTDLKVGKLNGGRRIDYVLQEAPFEYINEYLFALTSHVCYWESEDTMLLILKEIYGSMGIQTDAQLPQQSLSIERVSIPSVSTSPSNVTSPTAPYGMDPTVPISLKNVGPPPMTGFVRKS
ncbi:SEC23-interacting protein-like isoform X2 [Phymastichus coffea]|uniref:SEC23-interacting protein-like isoform X2 n=1 Tax=Phymastichus coffea TaxID=108790 RepID=UPI00273C9C2F|nr:SEC23-interacting protein-like isoform X2 [Phymastichus coffea]